MILTAHSMGGLIAREAINRALAAGQAGPLSTYVSFCSPYDGNAAANMPSKFGAISVPSWEDVGTGSPFLAELYRQTLPASTPFHLIFAFRNSNLLRFGQASDGTITLKSQLRAEAQREAARLYGYDETHVSVLASEQAIDQYLEILAAVAGGS